MDSFKKTARMNALKGIIARPHDDIYDIGELGKLKEKEQKMMRLTTSKGLKESLTKRLKPKV